MDMNGSQRIEASRKAVYAGLNDVDVLRRCIPGCESIERTSDSQMNAKATLRIGPVKASFTGKVNLSDLDPPNGYTISGEGSGGIAGFAKGSAKVTLVADGEATILHYTVAAETGGKLAQLGGRLIDGTAKKLAAEFFEKFGAVVASPQPAEEPAAAEPAKKGWFARALATGTTAMLFLAMSANWCCLDGSHAGRGEAAMTSICSSGTRA